MTGISFCHVNGFPSLYHVPYSFPLRPKVEPIPRWDSAGTPAISLAARPLSCIGLYRKAPHPSTESAISQEPLKKHRFAVPARE